MKDAVLLLGSQKRVTLGVFHGVSDAQALEA